ncbi:MAG: amino acid adenylation domain-containing protein, partial [Cyanobacteria bacterium P01_D01_bin.116]
SVAELNQYLQSQLPNYMIPAGYVSLDAFPLTVNGKIDTKALPKPNWQLLRVEKEYLEPRNSTEEKLCHIFQEVLNQEQVGIDDNFFEIGGDSIVAMQVVAEAQSHNLQVSIKDIYENPTLRQLSAVEELSKVVESSDEYVELYSLTETDIERLPKDAEDAYPLSSLQAGMLYHSELHPNSAIFHDIFTFDLRLNYQESALRKAITDVCQANRVLRTSFHWTGYSIPLQIVNQQVELPLTVYDLGSEGEESARQQVKAWLETEKTNSFDVSHAPLFRFAIHRITEQEVSISFSFHHAILDGWSVATLMTQLLKRYAQYLQGEPISVLKSADITYKDFILREQSAIANNKMRDFWQQKLSGMEISRVPRLKQVAIEQQLQRNVQRLTVNINDNLVKSLGELANDAGVPLKTVLLTIHLRILSFITGQSEVVTGNVLNGRLEKVGGENLLGLFLNTVPLRVRLQPSSWLELIKAVFAAENEIIPYRYFPLPEIQRLVDKSPLFEVGFNYVHFHVYEEILNLPEIECLGIEDFEETDFPFLVKFTLMPAGNGLQLDLVYDANQFESSQIEQYRKYYQAALSDAAVNPSAIFTDDSLMSAREINNWLKAANQDTVNYISDENLISAFAKTVENYPHKAAVAFNSTTLSFAELETKANRLAHYLIRKGIGAGSFVGLCMQRSSMLVVAILAILKAGAAYVPIDASYPQERINFILEDSGISLLLAEQDTVSQVSACDKEIVILENVASELENYSTAPVETRILPQHPAYVIYTSGSTGKPKGCVVTHANVIRLFKSTEEWFNFSRNDVWTLFHSYAFDFSVWELWGALLHGGKVVIVPDWTRKSPQEFLKLLKSEQVTVLNQTPSAFKQLIEADAKQSEKLSSLRYVIFGGEALELQSLQPWFEHYGDEQPKLINMYGITETTVHVTYREITQADVKMNRGSVIGEPIPDLSAYILDEYLEPLPVGTPGELYIAGSGVTQAYLHQPGLSAQRFIPNPFSKEVGSRLYRSGDLARRLPDGELEYLGRSDHQVKVRGFRIELGEIESALVSNPQVKAAYVTAGNGQIVAYFVSEKENYTVVLRNWLKSKLPEYMVPATLMQVELIPLTAHGKVDLKALPEPDRRQSQPDYIAPTSEIEAKICSLMAAVLGLEKVGINDDFFEIGGDSLKVTQLVTQLRETYQTDLPLPQVFDHRTPQALAVLVQGSIGSRVTTSIKKASRNKRRVKLDNDGLLVGKVE